MRTATLTGIMLVACTFATSAQQFTVLPRVGFEVSRTNLRYNNNSYFSPAGKQAAPELGVRMDYQFKKIGGVFAGVATSRSGLLYNFSDPSTGMTDYKVSSGNLRMHFEGGYQLSTKPIYFKKSGSGNKTAQAAAPQIRSSQRRCGMSAFRSYGPANSSSSNTSVAKEKGWSLIIQPLAGVALTSAMSPDVVTKLQGSQTSYEYQAGNWNTALITGANFEFGKNDKRMFTVSMNCLTGIGNLGTSNIATTSNGKTTITSIKSNVSSWSVTAGIPLTIYKKKTVVKQVPVEYKSIYENRSKYENKSKYESKSKCQYRCRRTI